MVKTLSHYDLILTVSKITLQGYTKDLAYIAVQGDYLHKSYTITLNTEDVYDFYTLRTMSLNYEVHKFFVLLTLRFLKVFFVKKENLRGK